MTPTPDPRLLVLLARARGGLQAATESLTRITALLGELEQTLARFADDLARVPPDDPP